MFWYLICKRTGSRPALKGSNLTHHVHGIAPLEALSTTDRRCATACRPRSDTRDDSNGEIRQSPYPQVPAAHDEDPFPVVPGNLTAVSSTMMPQRCHGRNHSFGRSSTQRSGSSTTQSGADAGSKRPRVSIHRGTPLHTAGFALASNGQHEYRVDRCDKLVGPIAARATPDHMLDADLAQLYSVERAWWCRP